MSVTNVNDRPDELQSVVPPLHVTGVLLALAELHRDHDLPMPTGVRLDKGQLSATVYVASPYDVWAWADALGIDRHGRHVSPYPDGSSIHAAWMAWHGWHLSLTTPLLTLAPVADRTIFSHCNWIGGCDTPLIPDEGSMFCRPHREAPLGDAMAIYARERRSS